MFRKLFGAALLVGGALLLALGIDASGTVRTELTRFFENVTADRTVVLLVAGAVSAVLGLGLILARERPRTLHT